MFPRINGYHAMWLIIRLGISFLSSSCHGGCLTSYPKKKKKKKKKQQQQQPQNKTFPKIKPTKHPFLFWLIFSLLFKIAPVMEGRGEGGGRGACRNGNSQTNPPLYRPGPPLTAIYRHVLVWAEPFLPATGSELCKK
jgi:hypothetical protein